MERLDRCLDYLGECNRGTESCHRGDGFEEVFEVGGEALARSFRRRISGWRVVACGEVVHGVGNVGNV